MGALTFDEKRWNVGWNAAKLCFWTAFAVNLEATLVVLEENLASEEWTQGVALPVVIVRPCISTFQFTGRL